MMGLVAEQFVPGLPEQLFRRDHFVAKGEVAGGYRLPESLRQIGKNAEFAFRLCPSLDVDVPAGMALRLGIHAACGHQADRLVAHAASGLFERRRVVVQILGAGVDFFDEWIQRFWSIRHLLHICATDLPRICHELPAHLRFLFRRTG